MAAPMAISVPVLKNEPIARKGRNQMGTLTEAPRPHVLSAIISATNAARHSPSVTYKRWSGSRNLKQPDPQVKDGAVTMSDMKKIRDAIDRRNAHAYFEQLYPGFELTTAVYTQNGINRGCYIHFEMRRKRKKR